MIYITPFILPWFYFLINTFMLVWLILGQRKTQTIRNNIVAKKTTELVLFFHKNITKLISLWPNMGQKCIKVLTDNHLDISYEASLVI